VANVVPLLIPAASAPSSARAARQTDSPGALTSTEGPKELPLQGRQPTFVAATAMTEGNLAGQTTVPT
jgi:hypothetical protein